MLILIFVRLSQAGALAMLLVGCGTLATPAPQAPPAVDKSAAAAPPREHDRRPHVAPRQPSVIEHLYTQYAHWKGVRYRLGGLSKAGIDCSGFVQITYRERFNRQVPRTTGGLARYGSAVAKSELRAGDLVFFKTGPQVQHVGIYLEQGRFLHASTSRGVMISPLYSRYWRSRYWQARRILPAQ